jgi:hypothetical protein
MAVVKHVFVIGRQGTSVNLKGPFLDAATAKEWISRHRHSAPCWLVPAEFAGLAPYQPLDEDGNPVREG